MQDQLIRDAISKRVSLTANYEYYVRFFSPHMLGRDSSGAAVVVGYQYAGGRRGGLPSAGDWACFYLAGLSNVASNADTWAAGPVAEKPIHVLTHIDIAA